MLSEKKLTEINTKRRNAGLLPLSMFEARRSLQRSNVTEDDGDLIMDAILLNIVMSELIPNQDVYNDDTRPSDVSCDIPDLSPVPGMDSGTEDAGLAGMGTSDFSSDDSGNSTSDFSTPDFSSSDF
jgi:hypothetical protein